MTPEEIAEREDLFKTGKDLIDAKGDYESGLPKLFKAARRGHRQAKFEYGRAILEGKGKGTGPWKKRMTMAG